MDTVAKAAGTAFPPQRDWLCFRFSLEGFIVECFQALPYRFVELRKTGTAEVPQGCQNKGEMIPTVPSTAALSFGALTLVGTMAVA